MSSAEAENPLRKAMASVDLLQALEDVDAEEPAEPSGLDDILLAELGPDADPEIPQAAAAIDRQLLLSRIVKARDAILAEEQQAARTVATVDRSEPASPPPPPAAPLYNGPAYDSEIAPEPRGSGFREALTLRRLALAVSVTALCIGAGWTLRSGELPGFVGSVSASMGAAGDGGARVEALQVESAAPGPAPVVSASVLPVAAEPPSQALAERMAPAEPEAVGPVEEVRIKERLIETHAGGQRSDGPAAQAVPAAEATTVEAPAPVAAPAAPA
ncbi:MAG: hypothetical protein MUE79_05995, partial [Nitratireductor sp.]|nr:hypothetical protein [Nitratireductor sp.]